MILLLKSTISFITRVIGAKFIVPVLRESCDISVLYQKCGEEKTNYPGEARPEAPSLPENQGSQAMLPQEIEKIRLLHKRPLLFSLFLLSFISYPSFPFKLASMSYTDAYTHFLKKSLQKQFATKNFDKISAVEIRLESRFLSKLIRLVYRYQHVVGAVPAHAPYVRELFYTTSEFHI